MPKGLIIRLDDVTFPTPFPQLLRDPMDAPGVVLIHDYANADTIPAGRIGLEGSASPTRAYNLARQAGAWPHHNEANDGRFFGTAEGQITYPSLKGLKFTRPAGNTLTDYLHATGPGSITPTIATADWLCIVWARLDVAGANIPLIGSGVNQATAADPNAFWVALTDKVTNVDFAGTIALWNQAGVKIETGIRDVGKSLALGQLTQIAFAVQYGNPNSTLHTYKDGVFLRSVSLPGMTSMRPNTLPIIVGGSGTQQQGAVTVHRLLIENLIQSGRNRADVIAQDYALNAARFG